MGRRKSTKLQQLLRHKEVEFEIGKVEVKEKLANAINVFLNHDPKLFSLILTEALENYNIYSLAEEFEQKVRKDKES